jgi:hypothetical protein
MSKKLTLTVEENVIKQAKLYAKNTGRSLSEIVENYLQTLAQDKVEHEKLSPKLSKLAGIVKLPPNFDEKAELMAYFEKKHL